MKINTSRRQAEGDKSCDTSRMDPLRKKTLSQSKGRVRIWRHKAWRQPSTPWKHTTFLELSDHVQFSGELARIHLDPDFLLLLQQCQALASFFFFTWINLLSLSPGLVSWNFSCTTQEPGGGLTCETSWTCRSRSSRQCRSGPVTERHVIAPFSH